jgi:hypothetical protein
LYLQGGGGGNRKGGRVTSPMTSYVALIGPDTVWPGNKPMQISDITDGTDATLLVVEVSNSGIHWMEPRDLHVSQMAPTINSKSGQGISSGHIDGAYVVLTDRAVRFLFDSLPPATIRALLSRAGGETVGDF